MILVVAATEMELSWLQKQLNEQPCRHLELAWLVTGVSMVAASWSLAAFLARQPVASAIQLGVAGTLREDWPLGSVVEVRQEIFSELGAESPEGFLPLRELGFPLIQFGGMTLFETLPNPYPSQTTLPQATGQTVNRVHGLAETIAEVKQRCRADVESMEGGAFFYAMLKQGVPFVQLRGLSNRVEPRNRDAWKLKEAALAAQEQVLLLLRHMDQVAQMEKEGH